MVEVKLILRNIKTGEKKEVTKGFIKDEEAHEFSIKYSEVGYITEDYKFNYLPVTR